MYGANPTMIREISLFVCEGINDLMDYKAS